MSFEPVEDLADITAHIRDTVGPRTPVRVVIQPDHPLSLPITFATVVDGVLYLACSGEGGDYLSGDVCAELGWA